MNGQSRFVDLELEGLFESPHDDPPRWAFMLTLYVDENIDKTTGMCFVAGYLGNRAQWGEYVRTWREELKPRKHLHLSRMRLGSPRATTRCGDLLLRLGGVPRKCGLQPFAGSVCERDYSARVSGTILETLMEGYILAILSLMDELGAHLPHNERVEVIFEEQIIHAALREKAMICWKENSPFKTRFGKSVLAKWSSIGKCTMTEAPDYLCYALHNFYLDPHSQKSTLTAPILESPVVGLHTGKATIDKWLGTIAASRTMPIPRLTTESKKRIRSL